MSKWTDPARVYVVMDFMVGLGFALTLAALVRWPMLPIVARAGRKTDVE